MRSKIVFTKNVSPGSELTLEKMLVLSPICFYLRQFVTAICRTTLIGKGHSVSFSCGG